MKIHCIIMAGGRGTRFWPESRNKRPKQLIALAGTKTLLEETIERVLPICPASNIHIVTGKDIKGMVEQIASVYKGINIIAEPKGRNTAPCIGYMASRISFFSSPEDIMVVLPSDHLVKDKTKFLETIEAAVKAAAEYNKLVTIGIKPSSPHTGYGYIQTGEKIKAEKNNINIHNVKTFKEKPSIEKAKQFLESGDYLWNAGMFIVKAGTMLSEIKKHMPELYKGIGEIAQHFGKKDEWDVFNEKFAVLPSESIDFGVIEKLPETLTIPADFGWNDLGSWNSLYDVSDKKEFGISNVEKVICIDSRDVVVNCSDKKKLIALLDVQDLIIIDTDDVLLVANRKDDQRVKEIVEKLKGEKLDEHL
ncbi:MAG: mannose-1-phosphate guanylyltransferase [bacterium]